MLHSLALCRQPTFVILISLSGTISLPDGSIDAAGTLISAEVTVICFLRTTDGTECVRFADRREPKRNLLVTIVGVVLNSTEVFEVECLLTATAAWHWT